MTTEARESGEGEREGEGERRVNVRHVCVSVYGFLRSRTPKGVPEQIAKVNRAERRERERLRSIMKNDLLSISQDMKSCWNPSGIHVRQHRRSISR